MSLSEPFIRRPVATSLLAIALGLAGALAFSELPVAPLPQVAYPTIVINTTLPGASPETMAAAVCHKVFDRHPRLRFAVVENGSAWVRDLLKKLDLAATQSAGWFSEAPSDIFRRHVWVTPFWEDDPAEAAELIGVERTLFGSDWPHAEGIAEPISYADAIAGLGDAAVHRIMRDNFRELTSNTPL